MHNKKIVGMMLIIAITALAGCSASAQNPYSSTDEGFTSLIKRENFDRDPGWEGVHNTVDAELLPTTLQQFGWSNTSYVNNKPGEIGGTISRSVKRAYYAKKISEKTLNDSLSASGKFVLNYAGSASGIVIGWFNENSRGWRTPNSLFFRLDGNGGNAWVFYEYGTGDWKTGCGGCFEGEHYQTTKSDPLPANGQVHTWALSYNPKGAGGNGEITFKLDGAAYKLALSDKHKDAGAVFNRFGIMNVMTPGDDMEFYIDDLVIDGKKQDFSSDPGWDAENNSGSYQELSVEPYSSFGYSKTSNAGGAAGEIGGTLWRIEEADASNAASFADTVGPLDITRPLKASGTIAFTAGCSDGAALFGWFNSKHIHGAPPSDFLGILMEGPSRVGFYFRPAFTSSSGKSIVRDTGPTIIPDGAVHKWSLCYSPSGKNGNGKITVTLDGKSVSLDLKKDTAAAVFDRFGVLTYGKGGSYVTFYLDNLEYTVK